MDDFYLLAQALEHADLRVERVAREDPISVIIGEELAAELKVQFIEMRYSLGDLRYLDSQVLLRVEADAPGHAVTPLWWPADAPACEMTFTVNEAPVRVVGRRSAMMAITLARTTAGTMASPEMIDHGGNPLLVERYYKIAFNLQETKDRDCS